MSFLIFFVLLQLLIGLFIFLVVRASIANRKCRNTEWNFNPWTQVYYYALSCDQKQATEQLTLPNIYDALRYTFDPAHLTIIFSEHGTSIEYQLTFYIHESKTYLKVNETAHHFTRGTIPNKINPFFIKKLGAVPTNYHYFTTNICPN